MPNRLRWLIALGLLGVLAPARASAWSATRFEGARAQLDVAADGSARVRLWLGVRVLAGRLTELVLPRLDATLALDADKPVTLVSQGGDERVPEVQAQEDGTLKLDFGERRHAAQRGHYTVRIDYTLGADAMRGEDGSVRWAFPATGEGLADVRVWMTAPAGTRARNVDPAVTVAARDRGNRAYLSWQRVRLPQDTPWPIELRIPARAPVRTPKAVASPAPPVDHGWPVLAAIVALAATLVRARGTALARTRGWRGRTLVPLRSAGVRLMLIASLCVLGGWLGASHPDVALTLLAATVALALDLGYERAATAGDWRKLYAHDLRRARRARLRALFGGWSWLDATTPCGLALLGSGWLLASVLPPSALALEVAVLLTPLWLVGTRWSWPADPQDALATLFAERRRLQACGIASRLLMRADPSDLPAEMRLERITVEEPALREAA